MIVGIISRWYSSCRYVRLWGSLCIVRAEPGTWYGPSPYLQNQRRTISVATKCISMKEPRANGFESWLGNAEIWWSMPRDFSKQKRFNYKMYNDACSRGVYKILIHFLLTLFKFGGIHTSRTGWLWDFLRTLLLRSLIWTGGQSWSLMHQYPSGIRYSLLLLPLRLAELWPNSSTAAGARLKYYLGLTDKSISTINSPIWVYT